MRALLLDDSRLVRAVAAGRRRGVPLEWKRAELRPVDLKAGRRLQVVTYDERQAHTANHDVESAPAAVDALLDQGFGNWHLETATDVMQVRITKKGDAQVHRAPRVEAVEDVPVAHDRAKPRLLDVEHPDVKAYLMAVGVADSLGRLKPTKQDKYRQVEQFVRLLDSAVEDARVARALREPTPENPWRVVDLGCGNAYLTIGAYVWLAKVRGIPVVVHGVDVRESFAERNSSLAARARVGRRTHVRGRDHRRCCGRPACGRRRRAARVRHRHRRRARPRRAVGGAGGARGTLLPPRPADPGDPSLVPCAVRPADAVRAAPRAVRRRADRRHPGVAAADRRLPRRDRRVRERPAHAAQPAAARRAHRRPGHGVRPLRVRPARRRVGGAARARSSASSRSWSRRATRAKA